MKKRDIETLCATINESTCPWRLRTDHEHLRHRQRAKAARAILKRFYREGREYREYSNGAIYPVSREGNHV